MGRRLATKPLRELPRTKAALEALDAMFQEGAAEVASGMSVETAAALDAVVAGHVLAAARAQAQEVLRVMRASSHVPQVQEAGGRFVAAAVDSPEIKDLLTSLGVSDVLVAAVKLHPRHQGVQDHVQYALLRLIGWRAPIEVLSVQELAGSPEAVSAALWALSSGASGLGISSWDLEALACVPWVERREVGKLAQDALVRFTDDILLRGRSLDVIGLMLGASVPGADHEVAAAAISPIISAMQAHSGNSSFQWCAWRALVRLIEGNSSAVRSLQACGNDFTAFLDQIMASQESKKSLGYLCRVRHAVYGTLGILETARSPHWGRLQLEALLETIESAEECDTAALLQMDAISLVCLRGLEIQGPAPAGIAALGRILEFLIQDATAIGLSGDVSQYQRAIEQGVDAIVRRLQTEVESYESGAKPVVHVYARALVALRNVSRRSDHLAARIAASPTVKAAVTIALERDYYRLDNYALRQLIAAVSFFSGLPTLLELLDRYPLAPALHESACKALVNDAEHQDGAMFSGSILHTAPALSFYATKLITGMVQHCPNPKYNPLKLAIAAGDLLGHVLGMVDRDTLLPCQLPIEITPENSKDPKGPVLEDGLAALTDLLRQFPNSAALAAEVCRAIVRVRVAWASRGAAGGVDALLQHLVASNVGPAILKIAQRFPENADVVNEATLAMGVLGGFGPVVELMRARPECLIAQQGGCRALSEMCRLGATAGGRDALVHALTTVQHAQTCFQGQPQATGLQTRAELAMGLLQVALDAAIAAPIAVVG